VGIRLLSSQLSYPGRELLGETLLTL